MKKGSTAVNDIFRDNNVSKELTDRLVSNKTNHSGRHDLYNDAVEIEVNRIRDYVAENGLTLEEAQRQVEMLVEDLRTLNREGIDLYRDENGNRDPRKYNEEFKKRLQAAHEKNWHKKY